MMKFFTRLLIAVFILEMTGCVKPDNDIQNDGDPGKETPSDKQKGKFLSYKIEAAKNPGIGRDIEFQLYGNGNITGYASADFDLNALKATFVVENGTLSVGDKVQTAGETANDFSKKVIYQLTGEDGQKTIYTVHLVPYTGLPVITITTVKEVEVTDRETWIPALMKIEGMGRFDNTEDSLYVRGRGNGTWKFPKKPFNAKLYAKSKVLGMNKHKRWCFLANYRDRTLMRNDLTFKIGKEAAGLEWTPSGEFAEVIFNGVYQGNFYVCEHIRVDGKRVNIDEMGPTDVESDALTGGYLLEMDSYYDEVNKFRSAINDWPVNIKNPDDETAQPAQIAYIQNYFNETEKILSEGAYQIAYDSYMDINSLADYYLVQTLTGNTEFASVYSVFCYKKRNGKLYAGPLWDFDLSTFSKAEGPANSNAIWYKYLLKDPVFKSVLKQRFAILKPKLSGVENYITDQAAYLHKSVAENWKQWEINTEYLYNRLNGDETMDYDQAVERMKSMYKARLEWLDQYIRDL